MRASAPVGVQHDASQRCICVSAGQFVHSGACLTDLPVHFVSQYREKMLVGADQLREIRDEFQHQVHDCTDGGIYTRASPEYGGVVLVMA